MARTKKNKFYNGGPVAPQWNIQQSNIGQLTSPVAPMKGGIGDLLGSVGGSITKGLGGMGGGILGGVSSGISSAISGGMSTGVGGAMQAIGGIASNIPGVGGIIGAGVNVLGGLVNRAFGSSINEEFVNETKAETGETAGKQFDNSSIDSVIQQQMEHQDLGNVQKSQVGKDGWFSKKAKNLTESLNKQRQAVNTVNKEKINLALEGADEMQDLDLLANYAAYGGKLYEDGGWLGTGLNENVATGLSFLPIVGTVMDGAEFVKDPSWENFGWFASGLASDVFTGGAGRAALKAAKLARVANKTAKARKSARIESALRRGNTSGYKSNMRSARKADELAKSYEKEMLKNTGKAVAYQGTDAGLNTLQQSNKDTSFADGGGIHIKKANRGKFTEYCGGKVTSECIKRGKNSSSPAVRKRATFAQNARNWHAFGGTLSTHGGDFSNGITIIGEGGTHEGNPNEGVQMGIDPQGTPNLVEEGEVVFNDYVFSNRLKVPKKDRKRLRLREGTFADAAQRLQKESEERPNDPISKRGLEVSMGRLASIQEGIRKRNSGNKFKEGGQKMARAAAKRSGYDVTQKTYTNIDMPQEETSLSPTWMRYAPVMGSAMGVIGDAMGITNKPDYEAANMLNGAISPVKPVGARQINNKLRYTPLDVNYEINKLDANTAAQRRAIINTSGGNRATAIAGLLAANNNYGNQMGDLHRNAEMYNMAQKQQVEGFNRGTNQYNADAQMKADMFNAAAQQQTNALRLKQKSAQAQMYDTANTRSSAARSANLTNLFDNLGGIGQENFSMNMINSNPALLYSLSENGSVNYKKNKKKKGGKLTYGR